MIAFRHQKMITALVLLLVLFSLHRPASGAAPPAPAGLTALAGYGEISLTWNAVDGAGSYVIYRSQTSGGPYDFIARTQGTGHTNRGLSNGTNYYYVVTALNADGQSQYSAEIQKAPTADALPAPGNVMAIPGNGEISLTWNPVVSAVSYNVYRATSPGGPYTLLTPLAPAPGPSFTDRGLQNDITYYYVVQTKSTNLGAYSVEIPAATSSLLPVAPAAPSVTPGSTWARISWNAVAGATDYAVYRATIKGGPYTFAAFTNGTTYEDFNLANETSGRTYYYVVAAVNGSGRGAFSPETGALVSPNKLPHAAVINAKLTGNDQVSLSWDYPAGAISYSVYRSTSPGGPYALIQSPQNSLNSFTDTAATGLVNGTTYYYVVDTHNNGGVVHSDEVAVTPAASMSPPGNVNVIPGKGQATVTWDPVAGATGYYVTVSYTSGGNYVTGAAPSSPGVTITNLTNNFPHYFRVQTAGAAISGYSAEVIATPSYGLPLAPDNLNVTVGNRGLSISWNAVDGAASYKIYRRTAGNAWPADPVGTATGTLFNDHGLGNGTKYYYTVAAVNENGEGARSYETEATPSANAHLAPINLRVIPGNTQATVTWDPVVGATGYVVTQSDAPGGRYIAGGAPSTPSFTAINLTNTIPTYFRVQAVGFGQNSSFSPEVSAIPQTALPLAPGNLMTTSGNTEISLHWYAVEGATGYRVYRRTGGSAWPSEPVASVEGTLFTDRGIVNDVKYEYLVSAYNIDGAGAWSPASVEGMATADSQLAPVNIKVIPGNTQATVTWDPVVGATGYYVSVSETAGGNYISGGGPSAPSFTAIDLTNTATYYFRIQTAGPHNSGFSSEVSTMPSAELPLSPAISSITPGNGQLSIRWEGVVGATGYRIYRRIEGDAWSPTQVGFVTGTIFTDSGLINGTRYYYEAAAVNSAGTGAWSASYISGTPTGNTSSAPVNVVATPGNTLVTLTWDPVDGVSSYYVTVATSPGGPETTGSGYAEGTIKTITSLLNEQPYYFRVQAGGNQWSAFSSEVSATPNPATNIGNISGHVTLNFAGNNNLSVQNATVSLQGTNYSAATDNNGNFTLINVPFGDYNLLVSAPGMDTQTVAVSLTNPNQPVTIPQMVVTQATPITTLPGDANNDDRLGLDDAIFLLQTLSGKRE